MMMSLIYFFYNLIGVPLLYLATIFGFIFIPKVRQGLRGRQQLFRNLENNMRGHGDRHPRFWIHCSSMGEFEQTRPLVALLKERFSDCVIVISFFSPSVFDHVTDYTDADYLCYLPIDTRRRAKRFISLIKPDLAIIVRHDFWPNHLWQLKKQNVPSVLVNCSVRPDYYNRFSILLWCGRFLHAFFDLLLTVSQESKELCMRYHFGNGRIEVAGDTRYDQVVRRADEAERMVKSLIAFKGKRKTLVAGSTWSFDETILFDSLVKLHRSGIRLWIILVPHEPLESRLNKIEESLSDMGFKTCRFSEIETVEDHAFDVLLVDRVGILASLYALGDLSFVGGGFGEDEGVHSVLEPAALGKIVIYGPWRGNAYETRQLEERGVAFVVNHSDELYELIATLFQDNKRLVKLGARAANLVRENTGATERIVHYLSDLIHEA